MAKLHSKKQFFSDQSNFYAGLYESLNDRLILEGKKVCSDIQLIEDSIQEIFVYFIDKKEEFDHVINIESYLVTILKRKLYKKLSMSHDQVSIDNIKGSLSEASYEIQLIQKETKLSQSKKIQLALSKLPKSESQAIKFRFFDGFSYEEIALKNSSTIRTVYNQIHSGIKKLRSFLDS